jgi:hypothetical protein
MKKIIIKRKVTQKHIDAALSDDPNVSVCKTCIIHQAFRPAIKKHFGANAQFDVGYGAIYIYKGAPRDGHHTATLMLDRAGQSYTNIRSTDWNNAKPGLIVTATLEKS